MIFELFILNGIKHFLTNGFVVKDEAFLTQMNFGANWTSQNQTPSAAKTMDDDLEANIKRAMPGALKMSLYAAKKQSFEVLKYTMEGMDSICNNAAMLKDFDDQDHLGALEETTKEFAVLEAQIARYKQTLEKMESLIESGEIDPAAIEKMIDDSLVEPKLNPTKHEFYKRFCDRAGVRHALHEAACVLCWMCIDICGICCVWY